MNGRVYDPIIGRFLSPDPVLQKPSNAQNYNKYSYVLNNPLKYVDPSGYFYYGKYFAPDFMMMNRQLQFSSLEAWNNMKSQVVGGNQTGDLILMLLGFSGGGGGGGGGSMVNQNPQPGTPGGEDAGSGDDPDGGENSGQLGCEYQENFTSIPDAVKSFIAVVCGESGNNFAEAQWIASCIINRIIDEGATLEGPFWDEIGGVGQFDAWGGDIYEEVMNTPAAFLFNASNEYSIRIAGALSVLIPYLSGNYVDNTNGSAFWRGGISNIGASYEQTGHWGNTYFFSNINGNIWP